MVDFNSSFQFLLGGPRPSLDFPSPSPSPSQSPLKLLLWGSPAGPLPQGAEGLGRGWLKMGSGSFGWFGFPAAGCHGPCSPCTLFRLSCPAEGIPVLPLQLPGAWEEAAASLEGEREREGRQGWAGATRKEKMPSEPRGRQIPVHHTWCAWRTGAIPHCPD